MGESMDGKVNVCIVRLAYGMVEHPAVGDFLWTTAVATCRDSRIENTVNLWLDHAPVYAARNLAVKAAKAHQAHFLCMIDAKDMHPQFFPQAPQFWDKAFDFAYCSSQPCVISAPTRLRNGMVNIHKERVDSTGKHLVMQRPAECEHKRGMEQVPGAGSGLMLVDMRVFDSLKPPYFDFAYDPDKCHVLAGEDIAFTSRCTEAGIPVYAAWDCRAGHWKEALIGWAEPKSRILTAEKP